MKEDRRYPPSKPCPPWRKPTSNQHIGVGAKKSTTLFSDTEILADMEFDDEFYEHHGIDKPSEEDKYKIGYNQITLQDLVDAAPLGAKLSDIRLKIYYPRYMEFMTVSFFHQERDLEAEEKAFQGDLKQYEKARTKFKEEMKEYQIKLDQYEEWKKQQDIKELEEKLAKLKK
jgi:hypothetical protein